VAVSFDEPGIQAITLSLISLAAVLSLANVVLGLFSSLTGKDPLPKRIRRMLRRVPASAEDFRLRGVSLVVNGAAVMLLVSIITTNVVVMSMLTPGVAYLAPSASLAFSKDTVFLVTTVAALAAIACFIGAYTLSVRVRYVSTRASTGALPGMPPA
jgi:hypothetical protein